MSAHNEFKTNTETDTARDTDKRVVTLVVTYNRKVLLRECLEALLSQSERIFKILIVDNASEDGTNEFISDIVDGEKILYSNTGENLGGAGGFSYGIKEAIKTGCDYIWIMDDDCIADKTALEELLAYAKKVNGDFGFLSSVVKWTDGSICKMNVQRKSFSQAVENFCSEQKIAMASFVSMFLNVDAVRKCGLPIKEFFIWGDDGEYSARISKSYDNYLVPSSTVVHKTAENNGSDIVTDSADRLERYFYAYRNESYFYRSLGLRGRIYFLAKVAYHRLRLAFSHSVNKKERFAVIKKGLKAGKTFKPEIEFV